MARTKFTPENMDFSTKAHLAAQKLIYPSIFQCPQEKLSYEDVSLDISTRNHIFDKELGIDKIIHVEVGLKYPLGFTVQERFRRPIYRNYKDLTITEWNYASNTLSELYKIIAGLLVYGYYDEGREIFHDAIAIEVTSFLLALSKNKLKYEILRNSKEQTFSACRFQDMTDIGIVYWKQNEKEKAPNGISV